jgi:hypothetical protein
VETKTIFQTAACLIFSVSKNIIKRSTKYLGTVSSLRNIFKSILCCRESFESIKSQHLTRPLVHILHEHIHDEMDNYGAKPLKQHREEGMRV